MGGQPETQRGSSIAVGFSTAGGHSCHTDSLQLCLLPFFLPTSRTSVQDGAHQAAEQLGRELLPQKPWSVFQPSSPVFFPISLHQPPCQAQTSPQFFFQLVSCLAGGPALRGGTNGRNAAMEVSRARPWWCCVRAALGLMGTAFAFLSQPRLRQGLPSRCPNLPQLWLLSRAGAAHPRVSRAGAGGRKRFHQTEHTNSLHWGRNLLPSVELQIFTFTAAKNLSKRLMARASVSG